jgi:membrane-associated phospholipid phosphatase
MSNESGIAVQAAFRNGRAVYPDVLIRTLFFLFLCAFLNVNSFAAGDELPKLTDMPKNVFDASEDFVTTSFTKDNIPTLAGLAVSTGLLLHYDQPIRDNVMRLGRTLHLSSTDNTRTYIKTGKYNIFRGPSDTGSALYFLGDGWPNSVVCLGFYGYGAIGSDSRAVRTSYALAEGILTTTFITQAIKRTTGRTDPFKTSVPGGVWRFFPNQMAFSNDQSRYDAFPSGHVTTLTMTVTVLSDSYPDNHYIKPIGYSLIAMLGFQMNNIGVHWVSDYPLAIAIGYTVGNIVYRNTNGLRPDKKRSGGSEVYIMPFYTADAPGVTALYRM